MQLALARQDVSFSFAIGLEPESSTTQIMSDQDRLMSSLGKCLKIRFITFLKPMISLPARPTPRK